MFLKSNLITVIDISGVSNFETFYTVSNIETMKKAIYSEESAVLCRWLTEKRHEKGLTQRQLASLLGIHHSIVGKIETGERQINVIELIGYCKKLEISPVEVIKLLVSSC